MTFLTLSRLSYNSFRYSRECPLGRLDGFNGVRGNVPSTSFWTLSNSSLLASVFALWSTVSVMLLAFDSGVDVE